MVRALEEQEKSKKKRGRPSELSIEDGLLMSLQYLREYPTFLRLGVDWGVHESTAQRIVTRTEKALLDSGEFSLPGKKRLKEGNGFEVVLIDVAESQIERPKKAATLLQRQEETPYPKGAGAGG
jgi:hypothetical protein